MAFQRRSFLAGAAGLIASSPLARAAGSAPVTIGVSGPLTGPNAQYGAQWKAGFDLALDEINGQGAQLAYEFEDSQSDPRQSVADRAEIRRRPDAS